MRKDPYLVPGRLPNLIAAIQAMGTVGWGSLPIDKWVRELEGAEEMARNKRGQDKANADDCKKWREIFAQHPEFFKLYKLDDEERAALRWRFAQPIDYNPKSGKILSSRELQRLTRDDGFYAKYTRRPLTPDQIKVLIDTAIELHSRVIAARQEHRWWVVIFGAVLGFVGTLLTVYFK